jgi:TPR repeat protein
MDNNQAKKRLRQRREAASRGHAMQLTLAQPFSSSSSAHRISTTSEVEKDIKTRIAVLWEQYLCGNKLHALGELTGLAFAAEPEPLAQAVVALRFIGYYGNRNERKIMEAHQLGRSCLEWLQNEADSGCMYAQCFLGQFYLHGIGVAENQDEFERYMQLSGDQGYMYAKFGSVSTDVDLNKNPVYMKFVDEGYLPAILGLARAYESGEGASQDFTRSKELYYRAAELGVPEAQWRVAKYLFDEVMQTSSKAVAAKGYQLLIQAARQGFEWAYTTLGELCAQSHPYMETEELHAEALQIFQEGASVGIHEAEFELASLYDCGHGVRKDTARATELFKRAAEGGEDEAVYTLAVSYEQGKGVPVDYIEAVKWFQLGANRNDPKAINAMGECYIDGRGVQRDASIAAECFQASADLGYHKAFVNMGNCYLTGIGREENFVEAIKWYTQASLLGNKAVTKVLESAKRKFLREVAWKRIDEFAEPV